MTTSVAPEHGGDDTGATAFDLGRRLPLEAGLQILDALLNASLHKARRRRDRRAASSRRAWAATVAPDVGIRRRRAESPYESLRDSLLVRTGFRGRERRSGVRRAWAPVRPHRYRLAGVTESASTSRASTTGPTRASVTGMSNATRVAELGWIDIRVTARILRHRRRSSSIASAPR